MHLDSTVLGGRATAGELEGRAVLIVLLSPSFWEVHDVPWDEPGAECTDSYWPSDKALDAALEKWGMEWLPSSELRTFIDEHFHELDSDHVLRDRDL
jgi:hypothetical protein